MGTTFGRIISHKDEEPEVIAVVLRDDCDRLSFLSPFDKMIDMLIGDFELKSLDKTPRESLTIKEVKEQMLRQIAKDVDLHYFIDNEKK